MEADNGRGIRGAGDDGEEIAGDDEELGGSTRFPSKDDRYSPPVLCKKEVGAGEGVVGEVAVEVGMAIEARPLAMSWMRPAPDGIVFGGIEFRLVDCLVTGEPTPLPPLLSLLPPKLGGNEVRVGAGAGAPVDGAARNPYRLLEATSGFNRSSLSCSRSSHVG